MEQTQDLSFQRIGSGLPILIIHGWTMTGPSEAADLEPIFHKPPTTTTTTTTTYSRIYIDLPGSGSTRSAGIRDLDHILARLSAFIDAHILPSRFLVAGTSCGGYLARAVAYKYRDLVDGLLLRVPVVEPYKPLRDVDPFAPDIADPALMASFSDAERESLDVVPVPVQTREYIGRHLGKLENVWRPAMEQADAEVLDEIRADPERYRLRAAGMHTAEEPCGKPTLIVTGRRDVDVGWRDAWRLMPAYPRATFVVLDRASHGLPVDAGEEGVFGALVRDWLGRVEELRRHLGVS